MRILLDENFPLALLWKLQEAGHDVDHIILLGLRGATDRAIVDRLKSEDLLLLTQDTEFLDLPSSGSRVILSRVNQSQPLSLRIEIWLKAIREYFSHEWHEIAFRSIRRRKAAAHGNACRPNRTIDLRVPAEVLP